MLWGCGRDGVRVCRCEARLANLLVGDARERQLHRPMDAVGLDAVAHEGEHGDAAVLDLRVPQETNRRRLAAAPEVRGREAERVVEAHLVRVRVRMRAGVRVRAMAMARARARARARMRVRVR